MPSTTPSISKLGELADGVVEAYWELVGDACILLVGTPEAAQRKRALFDGFVGTPREGEYLLLLHDDPLWSAGEMVGTPANAHQADLFRRLAGPAPRD